jgi:hypothetical protein
MSGDEEFGGMFSELSVHLGECSQLGQRALGRAAELNEADLAGFFERNSPKFKSEVDNVLTVLLPS